MLNQAWVIKTSLVNFFYIYPIPIILIFQCQQNNSLPILQLSYTVRKTILLRILRPWVKNSKIQRTPGDVQTCQHWTAIIDNTPKYKQECVSTLLLNIAQQQHVN